MSYILQNNIRIHNRSKLNFILYGKYHIIQYDHINQHKKAEFHKYLIKHVLTRNILHTLKIVIMRISFTELNKIVVSEIL